jgi:hypothetical protein
MGGKWNPRCFVKRVPFRGAIRHELGSNSRLSPAEISCYRMTIIIKGSVKLRINVSITILILSNTIEYSYRQFSRGVDQVIADVKRLLLEGRSPRAFC